MYRRAAVAAALFAIACGRADESSGDATACARHDDCSEGLCVACVCTPVDEAVTGQVRVVGPGEAWNTVSEAVRASAPGDAVLIRGGVYAEVVAPEQGDLTIASWPGEEVVLQGFVPAGGCGSGGGWRLVRLRFTGGGHDAATVCLGGAGSRLEEVEISGAPGVGVDASGARHVLRDVRVVGSGGAGLVARGEGTLVERTLVIGNAGHGAALERAVVVDSAFVRNGGAGVVAVESGLVNVTSSGNRGPAVATTGGTVRDSVLVAEGVVLEATGAVDLDGNVYWSPGRDPFRRDGIGLADLAAWTARFGGDRASVFGDPGLSEDGWHLAPGSPAEGRALGNALSGALDLDGEARPATRRDAGADQRVSIAPICQ
jgi:hypothetical protein